MADHMGKAGMEAARRPDESRMLHLDRAALRDAMPWDALTTRSPQCSGRGCWRRCAPQYHRTADAPPPPCC